MQSFHKHRSNRFQSETSSQFTDIEHVKKSELLIKATRDIKRFKKTSDRVLLSQSAKIQASKYRISNL
jgi:hypothetical protein